MSKRLPYEATIHVRDTCLCLHAQRAARALARRFDEVLKPFGLTNGQFSLLMSLNRPDPPSLGSVAHVLAMDRTTVTAALKPLERRGIVISEADPKDRRSRLLRLTAQGHETLLAALPAWRAAHAALDLALDRRLPDATPEKLRMMLVELGKCEEAAVSSAPQAAPAGA
jgi:DNA-binding MarR family transcriptional regulator